VGQARKILALLAHVIYTLLQKALSSFLALFASCRSRAMPQTMLRTAFQMPKRLLLRLALKFEKIQEMDVDPLLIVDGEPVAVDATIILQ
jgi:hypothetical protein